MAGKSKTPRSIAKATAVIERHIAEQRDRHERDGLSFVGLSAPQIAKKLRRAKSPLFDFIAWGNSAPQGGTIAITTGVVNPDPVHWSGLAVQIFVGGGNAIVANDQFLTAYDARFATLAQDATLGIHLAPGATTQVDFLLPIPGGVEKTGYFGNAALFQVGYLEPGVFLDRACVFFDVL